MVLVCRSGGDVGEKDRMPVAIVTGASRGLGRAVAVDLARAGWSLVINGRSEGPLDDVAGSITDVGGTVDVVVGDVAGAEHRASLVRSAERLGSLDLLVNNASSLGPSPLPRLERYPLEALRDVYEVNVVAPLALIQLALPLLRRSGGVVVAISSDAAVEAYEGWGGYGSSKAALDQLHRVLAAEETELKVYAFDPGDMRTDMHQAAFPGEDITDRPSPESVVPSLRALVASGRPSGRYRTGEVLA
jgi:NAD(P)-dependent dehydrogenase (short-subunit alcohol dehydrogenase family)